MKTTASQSPFFFLRTYTEGTILTVNTKVIPTITYVSDPTPSDRLFVITGGGWDSVAPEILVSLLSDGEPGLPGSEFDLDSLAWTKAEVFSLAHPECLTVLLPAGRNGIWAIRPVGSNAMPVLMNHPHPEWFSVDKASPGDIVRVIGRGMVSLDKYPENTSGEPISYGGYIDAHGVTVAVRGKDSGFINAEIIKASSYDIHFRIPESLVSGDYDVFVHNGHGGPHGWSSPLAIQVENAKPWPENVYNVKDYGAIGEDNADETAAVQAALDAAGSNGGGVVLLPPGIYRFAGSLKMPRNTVLRGTDRARVWLHLPRGTNEHGGWGTPKQGLDIPVFIHGDGDFGIENLNIIAVYTTVIIAAPLRAVLPEKLSWSSVLEGHAKNVFVRNCRIVHEPTYDYHTRPKDDPILKDEGLLKESDFWHYAAVALRGDNMEVSDCDIKGAGVPVVLVNSYGSIIARNTLRLGSAGNAYSLQGRWGKIIVEENIICVASNVNHSAAWMMNSGEHTYIARNHIQPIFTACDCEGLLFHLWDDKFTCEVSHGSETTVVFDKERLAALFERCKTSTPQRKDLYFGENEELEPGALKGYTAIVVHGPGLGQFRSIIDNGADNITVDSPWAIPPQKGSTLALCRLPQFYKMKLIDNIIEDANTAIHFWGCAQEAIMDGNRIYRNNIAVQDIGGIYYKNGLDEYEFAGCYYSQMLNNKIASEGKNKGMSGLFGGSKHQGLPPVIGAVGFIARGNVLEKDTCLTAQPTKAIPEAYNYLGVVFERNLCRDSAVGIQVHEGVEVTLRENIFVNVDKKLESF